MSMVQELLADIRVLPVTVPGGGTAWRYSVAGVISCDRAYRTRREAFGAAVRAIKRREEKRLRQSLRAR
jgi:hypothetical protein